MNNVSTKTFLCELERIICSDTIDIDDLDNLYMNKKDLLVDGIKDSIKQQKEYFRKENEKYNIFKELEGQSGIYKITFYNGSIYIGQSMNLAKRLSSHYKTLYNNNKYSGSPFRYTVEYGKFRDVPKFGDKDESVILSNDFFKYEVLENVNRNIEDDNLFEVILLWKEQGYIKKYMEQNPNKVINKELSFNECEKIFRKNRTLFNFTDFNKRDGRFKSVTYFLCNKFKTLNYDIDKFKNIKYTVEECDEYYKNVELNLVKIAYTKNINKLKEYISDEFRPQKYYTQILGIDKIILNNFRFRDEIVKYCNVEWKGSQMKLLGVKEEFDE